MKYQESMICWTPNTDQIEVGPHPDKTGWNRKYRFSCGACYLKIRDTKNKFLRDLMLFIDFNTIVVRDKVPVEVAHKAFLAIDEYRKRISPDMEGADLGPDL
jgi:hypothetical protein